MDYTPQSSSFFIYMTFSSCMGSIVAVDGHLKRQTKIKKLVSSALPCRHSPSRHTFHLLSYRRIQCFISALRYGASILEEGDQ